MDNENKSSVLNYAYKACKRKFADKELEVIKEVFNWMKKNKDVIFFNYNLLLQRS